MRSQWAGALLSMTCSGEWLVEQVFDGLQNNSKKETGVLPIFELACYSSK